MIFTIFRTVSMYILPFVIYLNLLLVIILLFLSIKEISSFFRSIKKRTWLLLFLIVLLAFSMRFFFVQPYHRFFIDESWYMGSAKNIVQSFQAKVSTGMYNKPLGWPALIAIGFFFFGINNIAAINTTIFFGTISTILIFLLGYLLFRNERIALFSSLMLALFPLHVMWSATAEIIVPSLFFILLSLFSFFIMLERNSFTKSLLFLLVLAYTLSMRIENILIIFPILFYLLYTRKIGIVKKYYLAFIVSIPFLISYIFQFIQLMYLYREMYVGKSGLFGIGMILDKLVLLGQTLLNPMFLLFLFFVILGFIYLKGADFSKLLFLSMGFIVFLIFYLFYLYSTDFHLLSGWIFLIILSGYAVSRLKQGYLSYVSIMVLLFISLFSQFDNSSNRELYILESSIIGPIGELVPKNCYLISEIPIIFTSVNSIKTIDTISFLNDKNKALIPYGARNCFFYIEDMYCKKDLFLKTVERCERMHNVYNLIPVNYFDNKDLSFILYELK